MTNGVKARHDSWVESPSLGSPRILAAGLIGAGVYLMAQSAGLGAAERRAPPYVWPDVAAVYFLSALPLAAISAAAAQRRVAQCGLLRLSTACLGGALALLVVAASAETARLSALVPFGAALVRAALAITLDTALVLAWPAFVGRPLRRQPQRQATAGLFAVAALLLMPSTYLDARRRHDAAELQYLLEQSRIGEAHALTQRMLLLTPDAKFDGRPLRSLAAAVGQATRDLEARVARPLAADAAERRRLDRVRDLAMLGRTDAALDALQLWPEWLHSAPALNLCGTIQETNGRWREGLACYQAAERAWEFAPPSPQRTAGLAQATTGSAYCLRKSGRYAEAESAYLQLLALSPTADTHFLLARFYEDTQQTAKARTHAKLAMAAAPKRYRRQGERLLEKLNTLHFGCLSGLFDRKAPQSASFAAEGLAIE